MTDDPNYDDDDDTPAVVVGGLDRKTLLIVLGGMTILAFTLTVLRARMKAPQPTTLPDLFTAGSGDWENSLRHLADGWEIRFAGIDNRINDIATQRAATATYEEMAVPPAGLAAVSMPPTGLVESNGMPVIERVPPVVETGPTADTPGPAATSM